MSRLPGPERYDQFSHRLPPRTPGPLGVNDAADPSGKAHVGDTPGPLGVNDGAALLAGPAIPSAQLEAPAMALVRLRREQLESAKRECQVKADTAAKYWKAWEDSGNRSRQDGDPALRRTAEIEMRLYSRQVEQLVKPAAIAYAQAIDNAVHQGCFSLSGSFSAEEAITQLLDIDALGQTMISEEFSLSSDHLARVLDKVADYALQIWSVDKDPRGLKLGIVVLQVAMGLGIGDNNSRTPRTSSGQKTGVRGLQEFMEEMFSELVETVR